jgi:hypothetical protein
MCHSVRVLTPAEQKQAVRLTGIILPVYASVALLILAGLYFAHTQPATMVAASKAAPASSAQR